MRLFSQEQRGIYINLRQNWQCLRGYSSGRQFWRNFVYIWLLKWNMLCLFDLVLAERALDVTVSTQKRRARVPNDLKGGVETPSSGSRADWSRFGVAQVDLFASPETAHCQWFYSLSKARSARMHWHTAGPRACANMHCPSEPTSTDTVQDQGGWGAGPLAVVDLLCVEPGPIVCLLGRIRRPSQGAGRGSSCGALVGIPICLSPNVTRSDQLIGNVSVT